MNAHERITPLDLSNEDLIHWNVKQSTLIETAIKEEGVEFTSSGAIVCKTGSFTGRSPKDKFIVEDEVTHDAVFWGPINQAISSTRFARLYNRMKAYTQNRKLFVRDVYACASDKYRLNVRVITEYAWQNVFVHNMFGRLSADELKSFDPDWTVIAVPEFKADTIIDGTRSENFTIVNFKEKVILIGGSAYTGEIKKGIFSVLNFILPHNEKVLSMHCSANVGENNDTALFFGLSGTGKTTLSADPNRKLIGDDEHGWDENEVFNFEGGCYAKCVNLTEEGEPQIFGAIRYGALLENTNFYEGTKVVNYEDVSITENTRVSYPIEHIDNALIPSKGSQPKNIFFLTCDAFGVLPPLSKLTEEQAMYHFISGYTAKIAGTEEGITEPQTTFSACFGEPFLPLHPTKYAEMLGEKMKKNKVNVWLVNTGWIQGEYGVGERISLKYTRSLISAALSGEFTNVPFQTEPFFGLNIPLSCPNVPASILNPMDSWEDEVKYVTKATSLVEAFRSNFEKFGVVGDSSILKGGPTLNVHEHMNA